MYESMLSRVPRYSVWPHLRRMMSSVPTLFGISTSIWTGRLGSLCAGFLGEDVPGLEEWAGVEGLELSKVSVFK